MADIAIIGGGNMGEALVKGLRNNKLFVCESNPDRARYLKKNYKITVAEMAEAVSASSVIILAVKPQDMENMLVETRHCLVSTDKLFISIAAGITTSYIEKILGKNIKVIRTMPNMPAMIAEGITAVCAGIYAKAADIKIACTIFDCLGKTVVVQESLLDVITAVSGSGPAYVFFFMECLMKAARSLGLKSDLSKELVTATFLGSIHLLEKQKIEPGILRQKVTSKGGTTAAALDIFLKGKFNHLVYQALFAAKKRAKELSM